MSAPKSSTPGLGPEKPRQALRLPPRGRGGEAPEAKAVPGAKPPKQISAAIALLALAGCYSSEGSGNVAVETHAVRGFTEVALTGAGRAIITAGEYAVSVSAEDDVLPSVRVEMRGDTLVLGREVDWADGVRPTVPIEFRVALPALAAVRVSGSGEASVGDVTGQTLRLDVSGSGKLHTGNVQAQTVEIEASGAGDVLVADLEAQVLRCEISGSGKVSAAGRAESVALTVSGAGLYRGRALRSATADVTVRGSGKALVWPERALKATVSGSGRVRYRGEPAVESSARGSGEVLPLRP